jgi:hypothetical protein
MFNTRNKSGISAHPCIILYLFLISVLLLFVKKSLQLFDSLEIHICCSTCSKKLPWQSKVVNPDKLNFFILFICGFVRLLHFCKIVWVVEQLTNLAHVVYIVATKFTTLDHSHAYS